MIHSMKVENFKCFEHLLMEFSNLNLFSGINSMGKSTVIQVLLLLRQAYEQGVMEKGIYLNGKYVSLGVGRDILYRDATEDTICISLEGEQCGLYAKYDYNKNSDFLELNKYFDVDLNNIAREINLFGNGFQYIAAERLGPRNSYEKSYYEVQENEQTGTHGEYAVHYLQEHGEADEVENENVRYEGEENIHLLRQTERWLGEITPGVNLRVEDYGHSNRVGLTVRQEGSSGSDYFTVTNVGFGISYALPVVLALLKAKKGEILLLENPEAHLHPKGQRKMGELIARAAQGGVQIILETHSDHILNGIRLAAKQEKVNPELVRLYYFSRKLIQNGKEEKMMPVIEQPVLKKDGRLSLWPEGFFDEWDKAIDELF